MHHDQKSLRHLACIVDRTLNFYIAGVFPYSWSHDIMKLLTAKCHVRATLRKLWRQTRNISPQNVNRCCTWSQCAVEDGLMLLLEYQRVFQNLLLFCFAIIITNYDASRESQSSRETRFTVPLGTSVKCLSPLAKKWLLRVYLYIPSPPPSNHVDLRTVYIQRPRIFYHDL